MKISTTRLTAVVFAAALAGSIGCSTGGCNNMGGSNINSSSVPTTSGVVCGQGQYLDSNSRCQLRSTTTTNSNTNSSPIH